jgi:hypothetical protein
VASFLSEIFIASLFKVGDKVAVKGIVTDEFRPFPHFGRQFTASRSILGSSASRILSDS